MKAIKGLSLTRPPWAKALIVAEMEHDDCDSQTDYFATHTTKLIALAWSRHERDLFPELRKAAALYPPTAHLGPGRGLWSCRVVIEAPASFLNGGSGYMYAGARSPWHSELYPEGSDQFSGVLFTRRDEVDAFLASAPKPEAISCDGTLVTFKWHAEEAETEHREKYSMGHGYYLKAAHRYGSGWVVRKYHGWAIVPERLGALETVTEEVKP